MTQDQEKPEEHLLSELRELRRQVVELQASAARHRQTEEALRQKTAYVELLKVVAATSNEGATIESVMQVCLEQICKHLGWPVGHVYRVAEDGSQKLVSAKLWYLAHPERFAAFCRVTEDLRFAKGVGLPGRVMAERKLLWIADLPKDIELPRARQAKEIGIKAGFGVPVLVAGEVTAVLEFFSLEEAEPDDQLLSVMAHIGTQLGRLSERKRAEATRRESEERYRAILTNIEDGYCEIDLKGNFTFFNDAMCTIFGYSAKELMGMNYRHYTEPEAVPRLFQIYNDTYRTGKPSGASGYRIFRKDGTPRFVETSASLIRDAAGQPVGFLGILRDITERKQTEEALRQSEERYRTIIEEMTDAYWEMNLAGKFTYFNDQLIEQHRRSAEELIGLSYKSYMGEETVKKVFKLYNHLYRTGEPIKGLVHEQYQGDGTLTYVESNISLIRDGEGKALGFRGISRDVTERKQTEAALQESKDYLARIINTIADPIFVKDRQHRFVLLNDAFCQFVGQSREAMLSKTVAVYCPPDEATAIIERDNMVFATGSGKSYEDYFTDVEGNHHVILTKKTIYEAQDGEQFLVGVIRDITELKQTEEALRQSEERYRTIIEEMTDSYWELDLDAYFTFFNNQVMIEQKRSREELLALDQYNNPHIDEENRKKVAQAYRQIYLTGEAARGLTFEMIRGDGTKYTIESSVSLIKDKEGKPVGFRGISRDITERAKTEEALRQSEERYRTLIENANDIIYTLDLEGNFTSLNRTGERLTGYSREDLAHLNIAQIVTPDQLELAQQKLRRKEELGHVLLYEIDIITKSGHRSSLEINSRQIFENGKAIGFHGIARDITERKKTEEALQQSEERYRSIIEDMTEAYWEMDLGGTFTFCNHQLVLEHQRSREELIGLNNKQYMDEEEVKKVGKIFKQIYLTREPAREVAYEMIKRDGTRYFVESNISLIINEEGNPVGFRGVNRDITVRKQTEMELQRAKETAEAASRAKSEFLANMSHEIRTPINGILGMTELALDTKLSSEQREYLDLVKTSADALISIINDILDFSKIEAGKLDLDFVNFNLRDSLNETMKALALRAHQKELNLHCQVLPEIPEALIGDSGRLRQILLNLVGNAIKFTDNGEIRVRVELEADGLEESLLHFAVSDTGIGIPLDKQQIIFEAFSQSDGSTTRRYGGTGLGLTISSQLVAMMGGKIWVESQPQQGSTFHFTARFGMQKGETVPAGLKAGSSWRIEPELASPKSSRPYHILLAEDNLVNQRLAVRLLEKKGHSVVVAENGRKAVTAFENELFDLILMDMQMPELNGYEATAIIREKEQATDQHIPIIALTAHTMKGDRERCLAAGMDGYVSKPIKIEELFETIEEFAPLETIVTKPPPDDSLVNDVIDRQAILYQMDGDEELFQELAEMFLEQCPPLLAKIQEAIAQSNSQELEQAAHKLKGSIATFEAKYAYEAALMLETMGRRNDLSEAAKAGLMLTVEIERLQHALFNLR